jgi:hypothetical protein
VASVFATFVQVDPFLLYLPLVVTGIRMRRLVGCVVLDVWFYAVGSFGWFAAENTCAISPPAFICVVRWWLFGYVAVYVEEAVYCDLR